MSLTRRVALWTSAAALVSLLAFAGAVYLAVLLHEREERVGTEPDSSEVEEAAEQVAWAMLFAAPVSIALSLVGGIWVSRRAFRPLAEVAQAAQEIGTADLDRRLAVDPSSGDLAELVTSFNSLLARLERAVADLDQYAAHVSHEIRTPLASAIADLEVSLRQPQDAEEWEATGARVLEDLRGLATLAHELLQLARQASMAGDASVRFDLASLLESLHTRATATAETRGIGLSWDVPDPLSGQVAGSETLIRSALWNVVENALRYTPPGGRVEVRTATSGDVARVVVDDSGPGIPEAVRPSVFDPFVRDRSGGDGVGVGLAVARRVVQAHAGSIDVDQSDLGGARLTITLPVVHSA